VNTYRHCVLVARLCQRLQKLRQEVRLAQARRRLCEEQRGDCVRRIAELQAELERMKSAHKADVARLTRQIGVSEGHAAAEHWKAFKWGGNYKIMELDLAATRTERDLAFERARKLTARVEQLEAELAKVAR
jgi:hypothetical protein